MTAWHVVSECYNLEILTKLQEWAKKLKTEKKNVLLLAPNLNVTTIWHNAVQ
jgi:hypothetical protein